MTSRRWSSVRLSLFGQVAAAFLVPAKTSSGAARRRGQGWPLGRRQGRLALDGGEHGGRLVSAGVTTKAPRAGRACAMLSVAFVVFLGGAGAAVADPVPAISAEARIEAAVGEASQRFALPSGWIRAVMTAESNGEVRAVSAKGAMGLMQIMPGTWNELRRQLELGSDPFDVRDNVMAGAFYLRQLLDRFGRPGFLAAYNAGPGRYAQHLSEGRPLPPETRAYVARVALATTGIAPSSGPVVGPVAPDWRSSGLFVGRQSQGQEHGAISLFATRPSEAVR